VILTFSITILFGGIRRGGFIVNTSILHKFPPFLGNEFASIVSMEDVQLITSLFFYKYQPLLEHSKCITFVFQECNLCLTRLVVCECDDIAGASDSLTWCWTPQVRVYDDAHVALPLAHAAHIGGVILNSFLDILIPMINPFKPWL
jgi:hypothetical protein